MTTNLRAAQRKAAGNDRSFNMSPQGADPLSSRSLMEARSRNPGTLPQKQNFSIQENSSSHRVNSLVSDRSTTENPTSKRIESISSKFNSVLIKRDEYPQDLLKELEYENPFLSKKHSVKKVFTSAAGRSISPTRNESSLMEHGGEMPSISNVNSCFLDKPLNFYFFLSFFIYFFV